MDDIVTELRDWASRVARILDDENEPSEMLHKAADDIVTRLRDYNCRCTFVVADVVGIVCEACEAADEIELLRKALRMACEELCEDWPHLYYSTPLMLYTKFTQAAKRQ